MINRLSKYILPLSAIFYGILIIKGYVIPHKIGHNNGFFFIGLGVFALVLVEILEYFQLRKNKSIAPSAKKDIRLTSLSCRILIDLSIVYILIDVFEIIKFNNLLGDVILITALLILILCQNYKKIRGQKGTG